MKNFKKIASFALVFVMFLCSAFPVFANEQADNSYHIGNKTIIFDTESSFTSEQQESIASLLANPEYGVTKANLLCTLFGHKTTSETVIAITHKVSDTVPRCMEEYFAITYCSRCDYTNTERTGYSYISCCPED